MHPDFWHQRWQDNQIGFHQDKPTPLLLKHWPAIGMPAGATIFVPLAGKSLDMVWFASQGYRVLGVELSPLAARAAQLQGQGFTVSWLADVTKEPALLGLLAFGDTVKPGAMPGRH